MNCPFNNITKEDDLKTATMFNNHLCTSGKSLSDKIPKTNKYICPSELINSNTFYLYPISISEICNVLKNCAMKTSKDLFEIDINLINNTIDEIKYILQHLLIFRFRKVLSQIHLQKVKLFCCLKKVTKLHQVIDQL